MRASVIVIKYLAKALLIRGIFLPACLIIFDAEQSKIVLQTSFGVLGILYSIAVSTALAIDLTKVRNGSNRQRYRQGIKSIVYSLTADLLLSSLLIIAGLLLKASTFVCFSKEYTFSYSTLGICSGFISLFTAASAFVKLLQFKDDLSEKIINEEDN